MGRGDPESPRIPQVGQDIEGPMRYRGEEGRALFTHPAGKASGCLVRQQLYVVEGKGSRAW